MIAPNTNNLSVITDAVGGNSSNGGGAVLKKI
jgi:hypothetical protein